MSNEEYVTSLFCLMYKLRNTKRKGWYDEHIKRSQVESVADHIFGCEMLAYAMKSEFNYDVDINKVILMLATHEIGETIIGDLSPVDMPSDKKHDYETKAVNMLLDLIPNSDLLRNLFNEFENKETKEAKFAFQIDKAECDLQARLYEQEGCFLDNYEKYKLTSNWVGWDRSRLSYDENFDKLTDYIMNNDMMVYEHCDDKIQNVISFYTKSNKLKDIKYDEVKQEHYNTVSEYIYNSQMISIIVYLIYNMNVDIVRVINSISVNKLDKDMIDILSNKDIVSINLNSNDLYYVNNCLSITNVLVKKIYEQLDLIKLGYKELIAYPKPFNNILDYINNNYIEEEYTRKLKNNI